MTFKKYVVENKLLIPGKNAFNYRKKDHKS